jgi:ribosomal protein S18 acetylase RimI-like enzyme
MIEIKKATNQDQNAIWAIIRQVIAGGDTYAFSPDSSQEKMLDYWCGADKHTYVATINDQVVGTFILKNNQPDLGAHVANASYMTDPAARGQGVGKAMGLFSLDEARRLGYRAMQFNLVVATNTQAVELWQKIGFTIIGEIPEAFQHREKGLVNALIMHQKL